MAIRVSYSVKDEDTCKREVAGLLAIADYMSVQGLVIIAEDEEDVLEAGDRRIEVVPLWKCC